MNISNKWFVLLFVMWGAVWFVYSPKPNSPPACHTLRGTPSISQNSTDTPLCVYGVVVPVGPREMKNGTTVEYWQSVIDNIPTEIAHIYMLSQLPIPPIHPRITRVIPSGSPHPEFNKNWLGRDYERLFGDSDTRIKWRSSLVLDFAHSVRYAGTHCSYILWLEDDAILPPGWFDTVKTLQPTDWKWMFDFVSGSGTVGVLINSRIIPDLTQYAIHKFDSAPLDWLMDIWAKLYKSEHSEFRDNRRINIIGHRGVVSTLSEADIRPIILPSE